VKPAGTTGMTPSGLATPLPTFGVPVPGGGSALALGCGAVEFCCAIGALTAAMTDAHPTSRENQVRREALAAGIIGSSTESKRSADPTPAYFPFFIGSSAGLT
jgi:hypothetical protein